MAVAVVLTNAYYLRFLEPGISRGILGAALFGLGAMVAALASWDRPRTADDWRALARRGAEPALLVVILGLAFGLRLWGITASLPQSYVADEYDFVHAGLRMIKGGDLNPHWWFHPSLQRYMAWPRTPSSSSWACRAGAGCTSATSRSRTCCIGGASSG